jgi:hypothetical protein
MIELLLPCGFVTLEYSWVKSSIGFCTLVDYSLAMKHQHLSIASLVILACIWLIMPIIVLG